MCERCEGGMDRRIEVTEETAPLMIHETTHVALQASAAYANGWYEAARGFLNDMGATWGGQGTIRMIYVWGAARFFLPPVPGHTDTPGHSAVSEALARLGGAQEPGPHDVSRLVAQADQLGAASNAIAAAVSKGDLDAVMDCFNSYAVTQSAANTLILSLMADAGMRLRHSREQDDEMAHELFMAHVSADLPCDHGPEEDTPGADL